MSNDNFALSSVGLTAALLLALYVLHRQYTSIKQGPRPPGPRGLPLIGNLLELSSSCLWEKAVEWGKDFGDMIYLESFGQRFLILNSFEDASELLSNRSAIYSSRPHLTMALDLERWHWMTGLVPYGDTFRKHRSYQQRFIGSPEELDYLDVQLNNTRKMLKAILDDPEDFASHVQSLSGSVILMNIYGHEVERNDRYVDIGKRSVRFVTESEHYFVLDVLPWLRYIPEWFPGAEFQKVAKEARKISEAMVYELYEVTKQKFALGTLTRCMTSVFLSESTQKDDSIADVASFMGAAATLYMGGVDTTTIAIMNFVLQMVKNPEVQQRAQAEIDDIVGEDRLPTFKDMENLPFVRAICDEVLRCSALITFVNGHSTTEDDVYKGFHIPKETVVLTNAWAISFDPKYFPEPFSFKPERWLVGSTGIQYSMRGFMFGFGRRVCPGQVWAEHLLFIFAASMLATFSIEAAKDEDGVPVAPVEEYIPGFLSIKRILYHVQCLPSRISPVIMCHWKPGTHFTAARR